MKNIAKKILSVFLSASTIFISVPAFSTNAAIEMWLDGEEDGFKYRSHLNYGYVEITGCDANKTGVAEIPSEIAGKPVTTIGVGAFSGCGYTDEELAEMGATHDGSGCGITEIIIPDSVTTIKYGAFSNCESLKKIHFPSTLNNFDGYTENLYINDIESGHFGYASWVEGCDKLEELSISSENPYFKSVNGIIYSKDGKTLGPVPKAIAFDSVDFNGVTEIGDYAFCDHQEIVNLKIPSKITSIGNHAFWRCQSLENVDINGKVTSIGDYAFTNCGKNYNDYTENDSIQFNIQNGLRSVGDYSFSGIYTLKEISLPDSLTTLGKGTFAVNVRLNSIIIPPKVTSIPDSLFEECYNLSDVSLPDSITEIGSYAFYGPIKIETIKLPSNLKRIGESAFACFRDIIAPREGEGVGLISISIPDSVEYIGPRAFYRNRFLSDVTLPKSDVEICEHAFESCGIESITLPQNMEKISQYAFCGCNLKTLIIPEGVAEIEDAAFEKNTCLERVILPDTLKKIGIYAFNCIGGTDDFGEHKYGGITSIEIPEGVTEISYGAFYGSNLIDIRLPKSLKTIGFRAFDYSNLSVLEYPEGITTLNEWYTMNCKNLNAIYLPKSLKEIKPTAIARNAGYLELLVIHEDGRLDTDIADYSIGELELVPDIYFAGTEAEWNNLIKNWDFSEYNTDPSVMDNVTVHFNSVRKNNIKGDLNIDGKLNIADMVLMQKWILGKGTLYSWKNGDLNNDGCIDSFDLSIMRSELVKILPDTVFRADISNLTWNEQNRTLSANVSYKNMPDNSDAWIGVVPSDTPHNEKDADFVCIEYQLLSQFESGNFEGLELSDTSLSGNYDLRVYENDDGGRELACVTFFIDGPKAEITNVQWNEDTRSVTADVTYANFSDDNNAWIGVVPSDTPHNEREADYVDVAYIALNSFESGAFNGLKIPDGISGKYDLRIYSSDYGGRELASVTFTIT